MHGRSVPPLECMTIRLYCSGRVYEDLQNVPETLRDVAYYKQMKFVDVETLYGIDSPANFIRFATDHYGELGLSRLNIFASNKR